MAEVIEGTYKLAYQHGHFHDFETELTINRDQEAEVKEPIGKATGIAIANNRLVIVQNPKPTKKVESK